jgi:hypothetical protein
MIIGISLFIRLSQTVVRLHKVYFQCHEFDLQPRHRRGSLQGLRHSSQHFQQQRMIKKKSSRSGPKRTWQISTSPLSIRWQSLYSLTSL